MVKTMIFRDFEELCDSNIVLFDVKVTYRIIDEGSQWHPCGDGYAEEVLGSYVEILSMVADEEVHLTIDEGHTTIKTFAKGTDITTLPGWEDYMMIKLEDAIP